MDAVRARIRELVHAIVKEEGYSHLVDLEDVDRTIDETEWDSIPQAINHFRDVFSDLEFHHWMYRSR